MKRKWVGLSVLLLSAFIALPGCEPESPANETATSEPRQTELPDGTPVPGPIIHTGTGTVTAIDQQAGQITIAHDPIASLDWPSMTMAFAIDASLLENVQTGDKVTFALVETDDGQYVVQDIRRQ